MAWSGEKNGSNGAAVLASGRFNDGGNSGVLSLLNTSVAAGDRIHFIVSPNGDFQDDSTRLSAVITAASPSRLSFADRNRCAESVSLPARRPQIKNVLRLPDAQLQLGYFA